MAGTGKGPLRIAVEDFLKTFGFGVRISEWLRGWLEGMELEAIDTYADMINVLGMTESLPDNMKPDNLRKLIKHQAGLIFALLPLVWNIVQQFTQLFIQPFMRPLGYLAEGLAHTRHPDAPQLLTMLQRRPDLEQQIRSLLTTTGYDKVSLDGFAAVVAQLLTPNDIERLRLRGNLDEAAARTKLRQLGLSDEDAQHLDQLAEAIPSITDLIQMAVREAWNEQTVARFDYDNGYDDIKEAVEWAKKQGLSDDFVKRYWRAHWQLPGVNQAYEMLHRLRSGPLETTTEDVRTLLKTADIPAFWRDRLIAISYNPYTRVDVGRMWRKHILDAEQVKQAFLDIGYDEEHATNMTAFVTQEAVQDKTDLSQAAVTQAYKRGIISRSEATTSLTDIGLSEDDADFYLSIADYDIASQLTDVELQVIQAKFVNGTIDEVALSSELGRLNLPSERVAALQSLWSIQRNNKTNVPSRSELDDLLRRDIITPDDYTAGLKLDGYAQTTIDWYVKRISDIVKRDADLELAAQQTEQARLAGAQLTNSYQINKAAINVQIAQLKTAIADIKLALTTISDPAQATDLSAQVGDYKNQIVHLQEKLSSLYADYINERAGGGATNA